MPEDAETAAHLPAFFTLTINELGKHTEWGAEVGRQLLTGTGSGNVWTQLHQLAVHAGTVGAFVQSLKSRRRELERLYPDRASAVRTVTNSDFDFTEVINFRNGMSHLDERIEHRWHQLATGDVPPPELLVRAVGTLDDGRERLLNWVGETAIASFRTQDGAGWHHVDVEKLTIELERMHPLLTENFMARTLGANWQNVLRQVVQGTPTFSGIVQADPTKLGPSSTPDH